MARRSVTGQLNMFELLNNLEAAPVGEVEMVSLMPMFEEEVDEGAEVLRSEEIQRIEIQQGKTLKEEILQKKPHQEELLEEEVGPQEESANVQPEGQYFAQDVDKPVMSRSYEVNGEKIEVAYLNYNKVRIIRAGMEPEIKVFASTKEAVDYYVQMMQEWEKDEK